jgi:hypothetical protein
MPGVQIQAVEQADDQVMHLRQTTTEIRTPVVR